MLTSDLYIIKTANTMGVFFIQIKKWRCTWIDMFVIDFTVNLSEEMSVKDFTVNLCKEVFVRDLSFTVIL